jgi:hypothetical protein
MNPRQISACIVAVICLFAPQFLTADDTSPIAALAKQYSAEVVITTRNGMTMNNKMFTDGGKIRAETMIQGMQVISIILPDQQKVYQVMPAQKMVMEMPFKPEKYKKQLAAATGPDGTFELVGPDTVDGVAGTKYKVTGKDGKIFYYWADAASKAPLKMTAEDGSFTMFWKNYQAGPQAAALFEPPADYQKMAMPDLSGMHIPGAGG